MYFGFTNKSNVGKSLRTSYQFCIRLVLFKNQKFRKSITIQEVLKQLLSNVNLQILGNRKITAFPTLTTPRASSHGPPHRLCGQVLTPKGTYIAPRYCRSTRRSPSDLPSKENSGKEIRPNSHPQVTPGVAWDPAHNKPDEGFVPG